ncbi:unnamed protein product [Ectocarpus sp. 12 AP-2014]
MGSLSILSLVVLFCLILLWSSSPTAGTWWEATVSAVYPQKPAGFFTGGSPPGNNNSPSQPHGHGEEANHHLPSWLFSAGAGAGEAPASGCISCQGDGSDQATYWLLMWLNTCALAMFLGRCAKLVWTVFVLMVRRQLEAKRRARPGPPAPALGDDGEEGAPANVAEPATPVLPPPQGTENVPNAAGEAAGTGTEVKRSAIVAAAVSGSALLFGPRPPPPLPARSISAPERLISRRAVIAAENAISRDVSPASAASRMRANSIGIL